jgi:capsule biosynthesis phosphatase
MKKKIDFESKLRISFDLDKTICHLKKPDQEYIDVEPLPGAVETLKDLKKQGFYIIISTARNQRTYEHNIGAVMAKQIPVVVEWLKKWEIPFDEIWMKPHTTFFVDDKAIEFISWDKFKKDLPRRMIEDKISEWHESDSNKSIYEYLGWTFEEYKLYVESNVIPNKEFKLS